MARRKTFSPFSPELLVISLGAAVAGLWLFKRYAGPPEVASSTTLYDAQGRPIPPLPPVD